MSAANGSGRPRGRDMTNFGISDTELLAIVDDLADENGWTTTFDVRLQLGENLEASSGVGIRLGWMRRYGWLERSEEHHGWRLTSMGHAILDHPDLNRTVESALAKLNPAQRVRLAREIATSGAQSAPELRHAIRRQWVRTMGR